MGFQEIADLDCTTTVSLGGVNKQTNKKNPTTFEGYFIGTKQTPSTKSKTGFAALHIFQTRTGNVGVWGKTNLDQKLASATVGAMTKISFVGMVPTKNNPMFKYSVAQDKDNCIEVALPSESSAENAEESVEAEESYEAETALEAEEEALDVAPQTRALPPKRAAQAPSTAQQAAVRNMLTGSRK